MANCLVASEHTQYPNVGTSVIGVKYKDGVLIASDMGGSYGSTLRYKSVERIKSIGKHSILGASGEISDSKKFRAVLTTLCNLNDNMWGDNISLGPKELHSYLNRLMYNRRNKFDPLWNSLVIGGVKNGQTYLGTVNMIGIHYEDDHLATGFGNLFVRPILRSKWHKGLTFEEAVKLLEECMRVLIYRDRSAINKIQIAQVTEEGAKIYPPYSLKTSWGLYTDKKNDRMVAEDVPLLLLTDSANGKMVAVDHFPLLEFDDIMSKIGTCCPKININKLTPHQQTQAKREAYPLSHGSDEALSNPEEHDTEDIRGNEAKSGHE